jgi:hypothetical protein
MSRLSSAMAKAALATATMLAAALVIGKRRFRTFVERQTGALLATPSAALGPEQLAARRDSLPAPVQRYLAYAISEAAPAIATARLRHDGFFRTGPGQKWLPVEGEQYFTVATPGFVWNASVSVAPLISVQACDSLVLGRGNMLVKVQSLIPVADARGAEIDQGASMRWMAEAFWFPYGFIGESVQWEALDGHSARVTLLGTRLPVSAMVEFADDGRITGVTGQRYRDLGGGRSALTPWVGRCSDYREFNGFRAPSSVEAGWLLPEGEFTYARFRVTSLDYHGSSTVP